MKQKMIICISIFIVLVLTVIIVLNHPAFGRTPRGERLVRIERSPNYKKGQFVNQEPTPFMTTDKSRWRIMWDNLTEKKPDNLVPSESIHGGQDRPETIGPVERCRRMVRPLVLPAD